MTAIMSFVPGYRVGVSTAGRRNALDSSSRPANAARSSNGEQPQHVHHRQTVHPLNSRISCSRVRSDRSRPMSQGVATRRFLVARSVLAAPVAPSSLTCQPRHSAQSLISRIWVMRSRRANLKTTVERVRIGRLNYRGPAGYTGLSRLKDVKVKSQATRAAIDNQHSGGASIGGGSLRIEVLRAEIRSQGFPTPWA